MISPRIQRWDLVPLNVLRRIPTVDLRTRDMLILLVTVDALTMAFVADYSAD